MFQVQLLARGGVVVLRCVVIQSCFALLPCWLFNAMFCSCWRLLFLWRNPKLQQFVCYLWLCDLATPLFAANWHNHHHSLCPFGWPKVAQPNNSGSRATTRKLHYHTKTTKTPHLCQWTCWANMPTPVTTRKNK